MCDRPTKAEHEAVRAARENGSRRAPDPRRPWTNTRPRGNAEPDRRDVERGIERLAMLLGH